MSSKKNVSVCVCVCDFLILSIQGYGYPYFNLGLQVNRIYKNGINYDST